MAQRSITIRVPAQRYDDSDDCLTAAAEDIAAQRELGGWDLSPRWEDEQRDYILLEIPAFAATAAEIEAA